ncbi:MAG: hypothetical protein QNJ53_23190 [Pleurocapsa sp. MO_192.B19]|nr:hypothetical protein [Pleurocapsa sp. MO_192.B19]
MPVNHYKTVYLSFISTDLPVWNVIEATASLYQKDRDRFHLLLNQQNLPCSVFPLVNNVNRSQSQSQSQSNKGLFWLDISPYRVMMTMQSNSSLSYRHFWERGVYGISRYCLNTKPNQPSKSLRFRNFTRYLKVDNAPEPKNLRIEYEMWSEKVQLGSYILHLDIET